VSPNPGVSQIVIQSLNLFLIETAITHDVSDLEYGLDVIYSSEGFLRGFLASIW